MDTAIRRGYPVVFSALIVFSIIEMSIAAWITAKYNANHNFPTSGTRARVRYTLFASIWTIVVPLIYLVAFMMAPSGSVLTSVASHFIFLAITWVIWLAAAAALTQTLGGALDCAIDTKFVYCGQLNALQGFAWLIWVVITFILILVLVRGIMSARKGDGMGGGLVDA